MAVERQIQPIVREGLESERPNANEESLGTFYLAIDTGVLYLTVRDGAGLAWMASPRFDPTIFVSTAGNDANPGTAALPVATLGRAFAILRGGWRGVATISIAAGTYTLTADVPLSSGVLQIVGGWTDAGFGIRTVGVGSTTHLTVDTAAIGANAARGRRQRFVTGALSGVARIVRNNTPTDDIVFEGWASAPVAGATFALEKPSVIIQHGIDIQWAGNGGTLIFEALTVQPTADANWNFQGMDVRASGIEIDAGNHTSLWLFTDSAHVFGGTLPNAPFTANPRLFTGLYAHAVAPGQFALVFTEAAFDGGSWVMDRAGLSVVGGHASVYGVSATEARWSITENAYLEVIRPLDGFGNSSFDGGISPNPILSSYGGSCLYLFVLDASNSPDAGVVSRGGFVSMFGVSGTGNATHGAALLQGATGDVLAGGLLNTITGTDGQLKVGSLANQLWATASAPGGISDTGEMVHIGPDPGTGP